MPRRQARKKAKNSLRHSVIKEEDESSCCSDSSVESLKIKRGSYKRGEIKGSQGKSPGRKRIPPPT
jgi:hypothetical protein